MSDTTLVERESGEKVLAVIRGGADTAMIVAALANVLARKLGEAIHPLPTGEELPEKFEKFFDLLFELGPINSPLPVEDVIALAEAAVRAFEKRAQNCVDSDDPDDGSERFYREDAANYNTIALNLRESDYVGAVQLYRSMDTYTREFLWSSTGNEKVDQNVDYRLSLFLEQYEQPAKKRKKKRKLKVR